MRLVDLYCDWSRQYATETIQYEGSVYAELGERVGRLDGYLLGTSLAVLACARKPEDGYGSADAWHRLDQMIVRYESEACGRLIRDGDDVARWRRSPPDGLCWGMIGVAGFDHLVRTVDDLDRLPALFERGVRVFQPVASSGGNLSDDRGLTDLGRAILARLAALAPAAESGPRPILDLAGMDTPTAFDALRWLDESQVTPQRLLVAVSHGTVGYRGFQDDASPEFQNLRLLRSRGGVIGLTPGLPGCETSDEFKQLIDLVAAVPYRGRTGYEGIAIGSDLLGLERTVAGLASARDITRWLGKGLDRGVSAAIAAGNARHLLLQAAGLTDDACNPQEIAAPRHSSAEMAGDAGDRVTSADPDPGSSR